MFRLAIDMRRIDSVAGKILLISHFLNFGGQLSWEDTPRGDLNNPCLWSSLLNTEAEADQYLAKLSNYVLAAKKVKSERTPGKFRVGINLNSLDAVSNAALKTQKNLKILYDNKLLDLLRLLRKQVSKLGISWMKICFLADSDTYLPILAVEYPGVYAELMNGIDYKEVCLQTITKAFDAVTLKAGLVEEEALIRKEKFTSSIYHDIQKDVAYMMLDFSVIPMLFTLNDIVEKTFIRNVFAVFFSQTAVKLPRDISITIADMGFLSLGNAQAALTLLNEKISEQEPRLKKHCK